MRKIAILTMCIIGMTMLTYGVIDTNNINRCSERIIQMKTTLQKELLKSKYEGVIAGSFEEEDGNLKLEVYSVPSEMYKESYYIEEHRSIKDFSLKNSLVELPKEDQHWAASLPGSFLIYSLFVMMILSIMLITGKTKKNIKKVKKIAKKEDKKVA